MCLGRTGLGHVCALSSAAVGRSSAVRGGKRGRQRARLQSQGFVVEQHQRQQQWWQDTAARSLSERSLKLCHLLRIYVPPWQWQWWEGWGALRSIDQRLTWQVSHRLELGGLLACPCHHLLRVHRVTLPRVASFQVTTIGWWWWRAARRSIRAECGQWRLAQGLGHDDWTMCLQPSGQRVAQEQREIATRRRRRLPCQRSTTTSEAAADKGSCQRRKWTGAFHHTRLLLSQHQVPRSCHQRSAHLLLQAARERRGARRFVTR